MKGLADAGISITIISYEKPDRFVQLKEKIQQQCVAHQIEWVPMMYHKRPPILSTVYDLYTLQKKLESLHRKDPFHIIHCRSYPTSIVGQWMKKNYKTKFVFDMRGYWADERVEGGLWNMRSPLYRFIYRYFKRKEAEFLKDADYVVTLTHNSKSEILSRGIRKNPIAVVPTCVDLNLFNPAKVNAQDSVELKKKLGLEGVFTLLYLGSWGTWYLGDEMLQFFSDLKKRIPNSKFLIVTTEKINLTNYQYKDDVIIRESQREKVPLFISIANASIFFIKPSFSKKGTYATKMGEIMAMNIPVITNPGWGDAEVIIKNAGGFLSTDSDVFERVVESKFRDTRAYCSENLSLDFGIRQYKEIYQNLVKT
jgi:glycosyltransferase involved in cell wall biosynthesis